MKDITNKKQKRTVNVRQWVSALFVCAIVLVVPVFSLMELGHFFRGDDSRSAAALPVLTQRTADSTKLPVQLFQEPLITVTFDDGYDSIYQQAMPLLQKFGIRTTQYLLSGTSENVQYVSWDQIGQMQKAGHEIACHTNNHSDLTSLDAASLNFQLKDCKDQLTERFGAINNFASPYGSANEQTLLATSKYFDSQRNTNGDPTNGVTDADVNTQANFNRYNIIGVTVRNDTKVEELKALVEYAKKNNGWIVLTYHQADDGNTSQFGVDPKSLEKQFSYLSKTDVRIVTMDEALRATRLQNVEF